MTTPPAPNIDWNQIVATLEGDLAGALTKSFVQGLVTKGVLSAGSFWLGPIGMVAGWLVGVGMKYGDWSFYMLADDWKNSAEGKAYAAAALHNSNLPASASDADKAAAEAAQKSSFDSLMS